MPKYYTCAELAALTGLSVRHIHYYTWQGKLRAVMLDVGPRVGGGGSRGPGGPRLRKHISHDDAVAAGLLRADDGR